MAALRRSLPLVLLFACGGNAAFQTSAPQADTGAASPPLASSLRCGAPDEQGLDARPLIALAEWVRDAFPPIFSILVSKNGVLVYELYTSSLTRDDAHYLMSVTKSFTSALVGAAMDRGIVGPPDTPVADALPPSVFATDAAQARFGAVTIKDVLGMSALDAQVPPHRNLPEDQARERAFWNSPNRTKFALTQALLPQPGVSFQYTDITPLIATGIVEYATQMTALEFAEQTLFGPMDFKNYEWMHEDTAGVDNGAYGLRLRPIDMQKFGILFLNHGSWQGRQLLPESWVNLSFSPWIKSSPRLPQPNYGWYWWQFEYAPHWTAHVADGWKGQRIAVIPEQNMVVTMTAIIEDQDEEAVFESIVKNYVIPSTQGQPDPALRGALADVLEQVRQGPLRVKPDVQPRMIPSITPKERHHPFQP
jgi:CubicO group peptidase (beta-lactamase class C family)